MLDIIIVLVALAIVIVGVSYQVSKRRKNKGGCSSCGGHCGPRETGCHGCDGTHANPPEDK